MREEEGDKDEVGVSHAAVYGFARLGPLMRFVLCYSPQHLASSDMASDWLHLPTQHLPIPRIWPLPQC